MKQKYILLIFISTILSFNSFEIDFGYQNPQGQYDKYNDPGYSIRATFSKPDNLFPHIKYDLSIQYLKFRNDYWTDYVQTQNFSVPIEYTHSEQSFGILVGPRLMSPTKRGAFRPYVGAKAGLFFFSETIKAEFSNNDGSSIVECVFWQFIDSLDDQDDYDCEPSSYTENLDLRTYFGMLLEIGTNFNPSNDWGIDFGIQYNIIPTFRPEYQYEEQEYGDNGDLSIAVNKLSKAINADYLTFYFGFNFNFFGGD